MKTEAQKVGRKHSKNIPRGTSPSTRAVKRATRAKYQTPKGADSYGQQDTKSRRQKRNMKETTKAVAKDAARGNKLLRNASKIGRGGLLGSVILASTVGQEIAKATKIGKRIVGVKAKKPTKGQKKTAQKYADKKLGKTAKPAGKTFSDAVRKQAKRAGYFK